MIFGISCGGLRPFVVIPRNDNRLLFRNLRSQPFEAKNGLPLANKLKALCLIAIPSMQPPSARTDLIHRYNSASISGCSTLVDLENYKSTEKQTEFQLLLENRFHVLGGTENGMCDWEALKSAVNEENLKVCGRVKRQRVEWLTDDISNWLR